MPIHYSNDNGMIVTTLKGRVTDEELITYYKEMDISDVSLPWRELIDASGVTEMAITTEGQWKLAAYVLSKSDLLSGGKVAMVAVSDMVYGMFRMWEGQRSDVDYEVRVFRSLAFALNWIGSHRIPQR